MATILIATPVRPHPPRQFRVGHNGDLACPHRDVSCCSDCAAKYPEIVDVVGAHYWVPDQQERDQLAAMMSEVSEDLCPACGANVHIESYDTPPTPTHGCNHDEGCGWLRRELDAMAIIRG